MNPFSLIFLDIIYRPIFNLLLILLELFSLHLWIAIIVLTLIVRLILLKPALAWNAMQKQMTDLQPKLKEIQDKYKDDQQKMAEETMKVFKQHWSWPLKGCIMLLIQIPVFIWLFFVVKWLSEEEWIINMQHLYSFLNWLWVNWLDISALNSVLFSVDLLSKWSILFAIIAWILIFLQFKLTMMNRPAVPTSMPWWMNMPDMNKMMNFMNIGLVIIMVFFVFTMPAWIWIYIITTTLFSVVQYSIQYRELLKVKLMALKK